MRKPIKGKDITSEVASMKRELAEMRNTVSRLVQLVNVMLADEYEEDEGDGDGQVPQQYDNRIYGQLN